MEEVASGSSTFDSIAAAVGTQVNALASAVEELEDQMFGEVGDEEGT